MLELDDVDLEDDKAAIDERVQAAVLAALAGVFDDVEVAPTTAYEAGSRRRLGTNRVSAPAPSEAVATRSSAIYDWIVSWATNRKLTQADSEAATPAVARTVRGKHAASRLGGISDDATAADCALYTGSGDACWGGNQSAFDDDYLDDDDVFQSIVPGACATCGYGEDAPAGEMNYWWDLSLIHI